jgi:hypothetical protein
MEPTIELLVHAIIAALLVEVLLMGFTRERNGQNGNRQAIVSLSVSPVLMRKDHCNGKSQWPPG